jgi:hypothetical protein
MMKKIIIILSLFILTSNCSKLNFFGFGEEKNEFDKLKINEYLWIASNELLKNYTNTQSNLKEGTISTDWILIKKNSNVRFRILIYILGSDLEEENIEIFTEKQFNQNGIWKQQQISKAFNANLKKRIILNATSLDPEK